MTTAEMEQKIVDFFNEPPQGKQTAEKIAKHLNLDGMATLKVLQGMVRNKVLAVMEDGNVGVIYIRGENFKLYSMKA